MLVRLPDRTLIEVEPVVGGGDPDGLQRPRASYAWDTVCTWLRINGGPWTLMARADWAALLIDVAKESMTRAEYEGYLKRHWHTDICNAGMTARFAEQRDYGIDPRYA